MCGIVGVIAKSPVNQLIYDALLLLQHRGQDAAGIVTMQGTKCFMQKARGMVREVFRTRNMRALPGNVGLGQVRYPTAGNAYSEEEAQPFYVNAPYGIVLVHNGNLTNAAALKQELFDIDRRHINTGSDTEVLINVLAHELERAARDRQLSPEEVFAAVAAVHERIRGSYAVVALIAGHGLLAFRDPFGIRPLAFGEGVGPNGPEVMVASESVAIVGTGHALTRDVAPGEAIFIDLEGTVHARQCAEKPSLNPCMFEYVYLARPDSVHGRHLGLPGAPEPRRDARPARHLDAAAVGDRRRHADPGIEPAVGDAARAADRQALPRGLRQEPLRRPHLHHAGAGRAQEVGAPEAERDRGRVQGQERPPRRRLDRARHDLAGDRPDGARRRREEGLPRLGGAAGALSERLRHRHADHDRADRARPLDRGDPRVHRRRQADLPGRRGDEARRRRAQPEARRLRGLVLRRRLHRRRGERRRGRGDGRRPQGRGDEDDGAADRGALTLQSAAELA